MTQGASAGSAGDPAVQAVAAHALELVTDGAVLGLGSGRAALAFIAVLGARVRDGLRVVGVPTSGESARAARDAGIALIELGEDVVLDLTVDGADEVAPNLDLVKGWGGALVAEHIAAAASKRQVILVGREKLVHTLGERGRIPVEVIPLARGPVTRAMRGLGLGPTLRLDPQTGRPQESAHGNLTLDCALGAPLRDRGAARALEAALRELHGVVGTGLFLGTAERVLVGHPDGRVEVLHAAASR